MLSINQVKYLHSLRMGKFRDANRVFIAEGSKLVEDLLNSHFRIQVIYGTPSWIDSHQRLIASQEHVIQEITPEELKKISSLVTPNEVLAVVSYPEVPDISQEAIEAAKVNAIEAGVGDDIHFIRKDFKDVEYRSDYGVLISNPPYGERLLDGINVPELYVNLKNVVAKLPTWSIYILTSFVGFANLMKRKPDRERKLYNGNIETHYYQFYGPKPPLESK